MASTSQIVQWSDSYLIGLGEIDDQHKTLIDLMNALWQAISSNAGDMECKNVLAKLERYTITHFSAEETMMRTMGYPDFDGHQRAHKQFVERLQEEKRQIENGNKLTLDILHFLKDWLVNHILVKDKAYAAFFADKERPEGFLGRFFSRFKVA